MLIFLKSLLNFNSIFIYSFNINEKAAKNTIKFIKYYMNYLIKLQLN